ncbi:tetratricopeptide repeat protein [Candidatus Margulisiibacteriota bacterium]
MRFKTILAIFLMAIIVSPALAQTPEAREAFQQGHQLFQEGKYYPAIKSFSLAVKDNSYPLQDYGYFFTAQAYQKKKRPQEALQVYYIVVNHFQNSILVPKALLGIAECRAALKKYEEAIATLRSLIVQFPKHELIPRARYLLGEDLEKAGKYEQAARAYQNLDLLHPDDDFAEKALERLDVLAKKSPLAGYEAPAATVYNLGIKYFRSKNYTRSKGYFTRLTSYYRKSSFYDEGIMMLGRIFLRKGNLRLAEKYFKKAINLNKDSKAEAMYYLALTYGYRGRTKATVYDLNKLVKMYPNSHVADDALYYIGRYYKQEDQPLKALKVYEKLVANYPDSDLFAYSLWLIGNTYYKAGDYASALKNFNRAYKLPQNPASDRLFFWAGKCAQKMGRTSEAVAAYKATISRHDHSYYGYRAREELEKYGIVIKANAVPDISEIIGKINGDSVETAGHEQKYLELMAVGLGDEAAEEASFLAEKVPLSKKDKALIAKFHAYVKNGSFSSPIHFAEKRIDEAVIAGSLADIEPQFWRFSYPRGYGGYVEKYAKMYGLDPHLVYAVIREESRFKERALSRSWAHGLMQIIPSTGRSLSRLLGMRYSRWKLYEPRVNIQMGTYYLSQLIKRFDGNVSLALAGYNGGPVRVSRWLKKYDEFDLDEFVEDIPLRETRYYVKKVMKSYYGYKRTYSGG